MISISLANFVRGGKSSIARKLAEELNTTILNFDPKRDSAYYNAVKTINIPDNSTIEKKKDSVIVETAKDIIEIKTKSEYILCDFGGRFDERLKTFHSDIFIIPTMDDYESISETIKATKYILKHSPDSKIIHILNMAMSFSKEEKEAFRRGYKEMITMNELSNIPFLEMPRSSLFKKIINEGKTESEIINEKDTLSKNSYRIVNKFITDLIKLIEGELKKWELKKWMKL